jgi:cell fate regulator YaaT (PSP1 superfamily)
LHLSVGDYVLTEADRGVDVGRVEAVLPSPSFREAKGAKLIIRLATQNEVRQLPQKAEREARALQVGQAKVAESGLPMVVTGAEFQFDGKKLTFYYSASTYIDFRGLVRNLFKVFGTRIWMVWNDPNAQEGGMDQGED